MKIRCKDKENVICSEAAVIGGKAASLAAELLSLAAKLQSLGHWRQSRVIELSHRS